MARGFGVTVKVEGLEAMIRTLEKKGEAAQRACAAGVYLAAEEIMTRAVRITPKKDGWLRKSAFVTEPKDISRPVAKLGFSAEYAAYVHERLHATNWTTSGTGPKFLERPMLRAKGEILSIIAKNIGAAFKHGRGRRGGGYSKRSKGAR